mgnify:CR=1 FL=1
MDPEREGYVTLVCKLPSGTHTDLAMMLNAIRSRLYILRGKIDQYCFVLFFAFLAKGTGVISGCDISASLFHKLYSRMLKQSLFLVNCTLITFFKCCTVMVNLSPFYLCNLLHVVTKEINGAETV